MGEEKRNRNCKKKTMIDNQHPVGSTRENEKINVDKKVRNKKKEKRK